MQGQVARCYADMLSEVCQRQPAVPERIVRGRPDQGVCWAQAEPEARLVCGPSGMIMLVTFVLQIVQHVLVCQSVQHTTHKEGDQYQ